MRRVLPAVLALAMGGAGPAAVGAEPVSYWLDPERTFVHWEVRHFGTSTSRGRFGPVNGEVEIDRSAGRGSVSLRIATAGVDTGLRPFDARLREADLLASQAFPEAYFVATRLRFEGERLAEVRGEFTLRGVSQPLSLLAKRFGCRDDARGEVCGGDFEARFDRSDFGMTYGLPWIGNLVLLHVQVEGVRR
jgi:polyisoprenoid-binding protein YceI